MQFLLLKGATTEKNDITRESRRPIVSLGRVLRMTTGRIFADNGLLGSFFSPPAPPLPPSSFSPLGLGCFFAIKFPRSIQTFSADDEIIGGHRRARFTSACVGVSTVNFRCTSAALERTRSPEINSARVSQSGRQKIRRNRFIPGNEKKVLPHLPFATSRYLRLC